MKFRKKYKILSIVDPDNEALKKELGEYEFDGLVEFSQSPVFLVDLDHLFVLPYDTQSSDVGTKFFMEEDNAILNVMGKNPKVFQSQTVKLSRYFGLQEFFEKNGNASCIVFYVNPEFPGTVFHPGNIIRVAIIE